MKAIKLNNSNNALCFLLKGISAKITGMLINFTLQGNMKQHMLTHKIRDMPPGFDKNAPGMSDDGRESPDRRSSPDKMDLKRSPPALPQPPMTHAPPMDMPPLPKRPSCKLLSVHSC